MTKKTQEEPDTKPDEEIVMKTVRLDSHKNEEARILNDPQTTEIEKLKLTLCQIYLQGQTNESVNKAKPSVGHSTDRLRSPTKKRASGTQTTPPTTPVPPKPTNPTAINRGGPATPGHGNPIDNGKRKEKPKPKRRTGRRSTQTCRKGQKWSPRNC